MASTPPQLTNPTNVRLVAPVVSFVLPGLGLWIVPPEANRVRAIQVFVGYMVLTLVLVGMTMICSALEAWGVSRWLWLLFNAAQILARLGSALHTRDSVVLAYPELGRPLVFHRGAFAGARQFVTSQSRSILATIRGFLGK